MWWRIKNAIWNLKWRIQRFQRGYADVDVWGMRDWFIVRVEPMLRQLQKSHMGYPERYGDEEWTSRLEKMANHLHLMDDSNVIDELFNGDYSGHWTEIHKAIEDNRQKFFEMFVEDFYDLWD